MTPPGMLRYWSTTVLLDYYCASRKAQLQKAPPSGCQLKSGDDGRGSISTALERELLSRTP
jgi:hypothetical protein